MAIRLYWWQEKRTDARENYGDLLSKYLVEKISKKKVITVAHPSKRRYKHFFKHYLSIGSIISSANKNSIVWGSGIIKKDENIRDAEFLAIRGPKTRQRILELGFNAPEIYGDPAILLPNFYKNKRDDKNYKIGIIPHYVDYKLVFNTLKNNESIKVIDLLTNDIEKTTSEILDCEQIISSSLHGVIVAQAYKIPALWVKFSDKLSGDNIKFYDYFESVGINFEKEFFLKAEDLSLEKLVEVMKANESVLLANNELLNLRKTQLLDTCPFKV